MPEEIVITVAKKQAKDKGGFDILDTLGNKYLLSAKNINLADALIEGRASKISAAKTSYGTYINSAVLFDGKPSVEKRIEAASEIPKVGKIIPKTEPQESMSKSDWAEKDRITRKSIERQVALKESTNIACAVIAQGKEMSPGKVIEVAKLFEEYLEKGEAKPQKSRLVEEAERLGGKEIKKGGE